MTGASSGIGKATVIKLVESGYQVFGLARRYDKLAVESALSETLSRENGKDLYIPIEFDITKPKIFDDVITKITSEAKENRIYGLVNNAGYVEPGSIEDITMNNLRNQFETNFFGLVEFTNKVLSLMILQRIGGRIVNISSFAGLMSLPLIGAYSASKHALEAISDALRMELWNTNIKVITINPGVIETNIYDSFRQKIGDIVKNDDKTSRFISAYNKYFTKSNYKGLKSTVVANVIHTAITLPNPSDRYIIGSRKEKLAVRLRPFIPDRLFYSLVAKKINSN